MKISAKEWTSCLSLSEFMRQFKSNILSMPFHQCFNQQGQNGILSTFTLKPILWGDVTFWKRSCVAIADAISKRRCDFKTQMRFQNADAISKRRCDFKTQMRFQNADAISKRRCDFKTQMRLQNADAFLRTPGYLYCECNRSWIYLGDAYHNKL